MYRTFFATLRSLVPVLFAVVVVALVVGIQAHADSTNHFTTCLKVSNGTSYILHPIRSPAVVSTTGRFPARRVHDIHHDALDM